MTSVLFVDGDGDNLWALQTMMESVSYNISPATNGEAALSKLNDSHPSVMVTDCKAPAAIGPYSQAIASATERLVLRVRHQVRFR